MGLGENVKFLREARGLTYEAVGSAVGTDGQNIFNLEKRKSKVSKFAPNLAIFFGVDLGTLTSTDMSAEGYSPNDAVQSALSLVHPPQTRSIQEGPSADEIMEVIALMQQSNERGRAAILDFARSAAKHGAAARWIRSDAADKM